MADDFKKLSKDLRKLNKSIDLLGEASKKEMKSRGTRPSQVSGNNTISNPLADARDNFSKFGKQAEHLARLQKIQTAAVSGMAQYSLRDQKKRDERNTYMLNKMGRMADLQDTYFQTLGDHFVNLGGLLPKRAALKRQRQANEEQIKQGKFSKLRTVSLLNMMEMMKSDKAMAKARMDNELKFRKEQKENREKIYREQRKAGLTAEKAFEIAKEQTKESEEDRLERIRSEDRKNAGLLDAMGRPLSLDDKTLEKLADDEPGILGRIFSFIKSGAIFGGLGAIIGDSIGNWLGDKADSIFGENSWLGNWFREWGMEGGLLAGVLGAGLATYLAPAALKAGLTFLTSPLGMIAGAGLLGAAAGTWLYDNVVGPWIDDFYERKQQEADKFDKKETIQSTIKTAEGKEEKAFHISEELTGKYLDITGGSTIVGETAAKQIAEKEGIKGDVGSFTPADFEKTGIRQATFTREAETGAVVFGRESFTPESALYETEQKAAREALQAMAAREAGTGGEAEAWDMLFKIGRAFRDLSNLYDKISQRSFTEDQYSDELDLEEQGLQNEAEGYRKSIKGFRGGLRRAVKNLSPDKQKTIREAWSRMISHFNPISYAMVGSRGDIADSFWDYNSKKYRVGIYGSYSNFYGKNAESAGYNNWANPGLYDLGFRGIELAKGGLVTNPISAIIGEAGPEAVIPLDKAAGVIGDALSKAVDSPSMRALASRQKLEMASSATGRSTGAAASANTTIVTNQNNSSFVNLTPRATTDSGPSWIRTVSD